MHIAYDPQIFSLQQYGGISRYFFETAIRLAALPDTEVSVLAFAHMNAYLAAAPRGAVIGRRLPVLPQWARPPLVEANRWLARGWLARHGADVVHETYYATAPTARPGTPTLITVLDMIHEKFPAFAGGAEKVARVKRAAIARADHIICISENTRRDLLEVFDIDPARVSVVCLGFSLQLSPNVAAQRPFAEPYILHVGKRASYKNFDTVLKAYADSAALRRDYLLVCFGDAPLSGRELALMRSLALPPERVRHAGGNDDVLAAMYQHAALFVYPSRYEGFGIPPLEAMSFDCPVVCSNAASLPEVVGDAALTFDPDDPGALRAAMEAVLGSPQLAAGLRLRGRERTAMFSWDICARQTRAVYASLLQNAGRQAMA